MPPVVPVRADPAFRRLVVCLSGRPGGTASVLFHPAGGGVVPYLPVAAHLAHLGHVRAVRASGLLDGEAPHEDVAEMADGYAAVLAADLPRPTLLFGWSLGGVLAWEVAARLADTGPVPDVVMVDSPAEQSDLGADALASARAEVARHAAGTLGQPDVNVLATVDAHLTAITRHRVHTRLSSRVLLLACGDEPVARRLGAWSDLADDLTIRRLPGSHFDVFSADTLPRLLGHLDRFLGGFAGTAPHEGEARHG